MMCVDDRMVQKDDGLKEQYVDSSICFVQKKIWRWHLGEVSHFLSQLVC